MKTLINILSIAIVFLPLNLFGQGIMAPLTSGQSDSTTPKLSEIYNYNQTLDTLNSRWRKKDFARYLFSENNKISATSDSEYNFDDYHTAYKNFVESELYCTNDDKSDWKSIGPNYLAEQKNGWVSAVYAFPDNTLSTTGANMDNVFLLGTRMSGIFRTEDHGETWNCVTDNLPYPINGIIDIVGDPFNPFHIIATVGEKQFNNKKADLLYTYLVSYDGGETWVRGEVFTEDGMEIPFMVNTIFHPTIPNLIFSSMDDDLMLYSSNGGQSWKKLNAPADHPVYNSEIIGEKNYKLHHRNAKIYASSQNFYLVTDNYYNESMFFFEGELILSGSNVSVNWKSADQSIFDLNGDQVDRNLGTLKTKNLKISNYAHNRLLFLSHEESPNVDLTPPIQIDDVIRAKGDLDMGYTIICSHRTSLENLELIFHQGWKNEKCEFVQSPNNIDNYYVAGIAGFRRYQTNDCTIPPININGSTFDGYHADARSSIIVTRNGMDHLILGNDGGIAEIANANGSFLPRILNGNLSINLIYTVSIDQKSGKIIVGMQDNEHLVYNENQGWEPIETSIEGSTAMIYEKDPNIYIWDYGLYSYLYSTNNYFFPITNVPGLELPTSSENYRHYPERFTISLAKVSNTNDNRLLMLKGQNIIEFKQLPNTDHMGAIGICQRNPRYIFTGPRNVSGFNEAPKLYRSAEDGDVDSWVSLENSNVTFDGGSGTLNQVLDWKFVNSIGVDHINPQLLYVGASGIAKANNEIRNEYLRVLKSENGGDSFIDFSQGLPAIPVTKILTIESDNHLVFVGTYAGVYYRHDGMERWECFNNNLPKTFITDLDYNYCTKELLASTFGRGAWKSPVLNIDVTSSYAIEITENTIWENTPLSFKENIRIKAGKTLTINNNVIYFETGKKIIVEPGARLNVTNARLTSMCTNFWQGIEVWGNASLSQAAANQGLVQLTNATIENAQNGLSFMKPGDWSTTGGFVFATKTTFKNCRRGAEFLAYHNYSTSSPNIEIKHRAFFNNCSFIWDEDFNHPSLPHAITMYHVNGVRISGCDFIDERSQEITTPRVKAIFTLDAGYSVVGRSTITYPNEEPLHTEFSTSDMDVNIFSKMHTGIEAMNANTPYTVTVDHSHFKNSFIGLNIKAIDNAVTTRNYFELDPSSTAEDLQVMLMQNFDRSTGYVNEGNIFRGNSSYLCRGTTIYNSGLEANLVRNNKYYNLQVGNAAYYMNTNDNEIIDQSKGLEWNCNKNYDGKLDFKSYNSSNNIPFQGVLFFQGNTNQASGYVFSQNINYELPLQDYHIRSSNDNMLRHYSTNNTIEVPTQLYGNINNIIVTQSNGCLTKFTDFSVGKGKTFNGPKLLQKIGELAAVNDQIALKKLEIDSLLQAGNRAELQNLISSINQSNKNQIKQLLKSEAPYLSAEVLKMIGQKPTNLIPHSWYKDLILDNVEIARKNEFIDFLKTKNTPLPNAQVKEIKEKRYTNITVRGLKEMKIAELKAKKEGILNELLVHELSDTNEVNWNTYRTLVNQRNHEFEKAEKVELFMALKKFDKVDSTLLKMEIDLGNIKHEIIKIEMSDFILFKRYLLGKISENEGFLASLNDEEIKELEYMAINLTGKAQTEAQNILCFFAYKCKDLEIPKDDEIKGLKIASEEEQITEQRESKFQIRPNPNKGCFEITSNENCVIKEIKITNIMGHSVAFEIIEHNDNISLVELKNSQSGLYIVQVVCDDGTIEKNNMIILK